MHCFTFMPRHLSLDWCIVDTQKILLDWMDERGKVLWNNEVKLTLMWCVSWVEKSSGEQCGGLERQHAVGTEGRQSRPEGSGTVARAVPGPEFMNSLRSDLTFSWGS